ncbi:MAG TPA: class II fructose-bisphosphatase [Anaerolineae bacterium]|nr:class II fructose-bisphosphatase [Anaerolineae bacterium]
MSNLPNRNLALEFVRATEAAALAAAKWIGRGDKEAGDQAAVDAFRLLLNSIRMDGVIVIGEGEKDNAPMLFNGEHVGAGQGVAVDIALDPVEGTTLLAKGTNGAIAVVAIAQRGAMWQPGAAFYMDKLIVGPAAAGKVDLDAPVRDNLQAVAAAKGVNVAELTVVLLDRPRNAEKIAAVRAAGGRARLISDGDVAPALMTALPDTGIDVVMGIGGTPEGVITACAMRCMGGEIQGRLAPQLATEKARLLADGVDIGRKLTTQDFVSGDDHFFAATGITNGNFLRGVRYDQRGAVTHSLVMRSKSGTWRTIESHHCWDRLTDISVIPYR